MLVLLTRAIDDAMRTAATLSAIGHHAILSPVLEMAPTGAQWPQGVVDAVLATSMQGFELFSNSSELPSPEGRRLLPLHVVGERTYAAARDRGFDGRASIAPDARELAATLVDALPAASARLVYLAGRDRKPELESRLKEAGHVVEIVEVYAAQPVDALDEEAAALIEADQIGAVMHYSRRSAEIFLNLADEAGLDAAGLIHVAISPDAAQPLRCKGAKVIHVAEQPNEQSMLAALRVIAAQELVDSGGKP